MQTYGEGREEIPYLMATPRGSAARCEGYERKREKGSRRVIHNVWVLFGNPNVLDAPKLSQVWTHPLWATPNSMGRTDGWMDGWPLASLLEDVNISFFLFVVKHAIRYLCVSLCLTRLLFWLVHAVIVLVTLSLERASDHHDPLEFLVIVQFLVFAPVRRMSWNDTVQEVFWGYEAGGLCTICVLCIVTKACGLKVSFAVLCVPPQ